MLLSLSGSGGSEEEVACGKGKGGKENVYINLLLLLFVNSVQDTTDLQPQPGAQEENKRYHPLAYLAV